jgi:hypothetical protein
MDEISGLAIRRCGGRPSDRLLFWRAILNALRADFDPRFLLALAAAVQRDLERLNQVRWHRQVSLA